MKADVAITEVVAEFYRASGLHPKFNSAHEGYAVILEEMDELKAEVWKNPRRVYGSDPAGPEIHRTLMREEAVQIAAMALRFLTDVC